MISGPQSRAARGLLGISQMELAKAAGVSERAIVKFEAGKKKTQASTKMVIRMALESMGVEFIGDRGLQLKAGSDPESSP
ncbi:helix-turn-helix domain protein (plasmid) [Thalassoporum mexicanum PCC 7367]|nr:helix-turn-helix domain protein [Pseudanabaena sp. PCC 7367]